MKGRGDSWVVLISEKPQFIFSLEFFWKKQKIQKNESNFVVVGFRHGSSQRKIERDTCSIFYSSDICFVTGKT